MRQDQIFYTGRGYDELLKLYWQLEENDKADALITSLNNADITASEKINVAKVLLCKHNFMEQSYWIITQFCKKSAK